MFVSLLHVIAFTSFATGVWSHWSYKGKEGNSDINGKINHGTQGVRYLYPT